MPLLYEQETAEMSEVYKATPSEMAKELLYYVYNAGHYYCDIHHCMKREKQSGFALCYVVNGRMCFRTDRYENTVHAGEMCFINGREPFYCTALESMEYLWICFDGLNTKAFWETIRKQYGMVIHVDETERFHTRMIQLIDCMHITGLVDEGTISCRLHDLLCSLLYINTVGNVSDPQIAEVQHYLCEHLAEDLSTSVLAKEFHLSVSQLNRKFREITGQSPHEYLVSMRMNRAKVLLRESSLSIAEIAGAVGYAYDTSFAAVFRSKVGMSPREYRNMCV